MLDECFGLGPGIEHIRRHSEPAFPEMPSAHDLGYGNALQTLLHGALEDRQRQIIRPVPILTADLFAVSEIGIVPKPPHIGGRVGDASVA